MKQSREIHIKAINRYVILRRNWAWWFIASIIILSVINPWTLFATALALVYAGAWAMHNTRFYVWLDYEEDKVEIYARGIERDYHIGYVDDWSILDHNSHDEVQREIVDEFCRDVNLKVFMATIKQLIVPVVRISKPRRR